MSSPPLVTFSLPKRIVLPNVNSSTSVAGAAYISFLIIIIYVLICYCRLHYCFQGCLEGRFLTIVFPLLEPTLIINHLRHNRHYAHTVFTRRITRHSALARGGIGIAPLAALARKATWAVVLRRGEEIKNVHEATIGSVDIWPVKKKRNSYSRNASFRPSFTSVSICETALYKSGIFPLTVL